MPEPGLLIGVAALAAVISVVLTVIILLQMRSGRDTESRALTETLRSHMEHQFQMATQAAVSREAVLRQEIERMGDRQVQSLNTLREASDETARAHRTELTDSFGKLSKSVSERLGESTDHQKGNAERLDGQMRQQTETIGKASDQLRSEVTSKFQNLSEVLKADMERMSKAQNERLEKLVETVRLGTETHDRKQAELRQALEQKFEQLRKENEAKLEKMRETVDEKLQSTLEKRLGASFKQVNENLERVHKSVGEMQTIATGVGDLKRVLTNVKARGTWGEVTLGNLLEQVLTPSQYATNVEVEPGSSERVEYAVRLPGDDEQPVWLPIDAKLPTEDYERLSLAAESGDHAAVEDASRALEKAIRKEAKSISEKYVKPPFTTDFGLMFLPTEGLYAEAIRRPGLMDSLQRELRVVITGPTTLLALLNSLQMGFKTLAIQERSSEVWRILGAVKTEFGKFEATFTKVEKKLQEAQNVIKDAGVRRRAIDRKMRDVEGMTLADAAQILSLPTPSKDDEEDDDTEDQTASLL